MKPGQRQIERIKQNEALYDELFRAASAADDALNALRALKPKIDQLTAYYESRLWKKDFADDEAGKLPSDLRRGVLSEDGVYDLLGRIKELLR